MNEEGFSSRIDGSRHLLEIKQVSDAGLQEEIRHERGKQAADNKL